jgi:hypothetical protein
MADVERIRRETADALTEAGIADVSLDYIDDEFVSELPAIMEPDTKPLADWEADTDHSPLIEEDVVEDRGTSPDAGERGTTHAGADEAPISRHVRYVWRPARSGGLWHFSWWRSGECTSRRGAGVVSLISDSGVTCGGTGEKIYRITWYTN